MEEGTDTKELFIGDGLIDVEVEYKKKVWKFRFKQMSWKERTDLLQKCGNLTAAGISDISLVNYIDQLCAKFLVSAPDGFDYRKVTPEFGDKFVIAVSNKIGLHTEDIPDKEIKN